MTFGLYPSPVRTCYIRAMKKLVLATCVLAAFSASAFSAETNNHPITKHKVTQRTGQHATNPYLAHANHKAKRGKHKKI